MYFCSDDEERHMNLNHKKQGNIKEKYLNISKNKIKEKSMNKKNAKKMMTPMQNKYTKKMTKQNITPYLGKKVNSKMIQKKPNKTNNSNEDSKSCDNQNITPDNIKKSEYILPFSLIDSYCGKHNEVFKYYCFNCHQNFCELCLKEHINHHLIKFDEILLSDEELDSKKNELNKAKEDLVKLNEYFSALIEAIKCKFERLFNIKKKELDIKEKIIIDYETIKYNYHSINNIRNIKFENNDKFFDLSPNTDWFNRFNLIFKYLNTNLSHKDNDIFDILKSNFTNEKNNAKIISKKYNMNNINKIILLKNEDILALNENKNIIIFDKDKFEEKLNIKISEKNNLYINDILQRNDGGLICSGYEYIKFINLGLDNQYYNLVDEIKDVGSNINSILEFNNNLILSLNDYSKLKLWKKNNKYKYTCIDSYNYNITDNNTEEISKLFIIKPNSFVLSSKRENCFYKFIINNNDKIELEKKLDDIDFNNGNIDMINLHDENYFMVSCIDYLLLVDKNKFSVIQKFSLNHKLINLYNYSENYFIALDSMNNLYKIEFDKYQQKLFFEDNINLNNNYPDFENGINNIIINENKENIIMQMNDKFVKIYNKE